MFKRIRDGRTGVAMALALAVGALFGASVVSVASPQATTTYNRSVSCGGLNFYPASDSTTWGEDGVLRTGSGALRCNASIPHGAVVKSVQFTVLDNDPGSLNYCGLVRTNLVATAAAPGGYVFMANTTPSGTSNSASPQRLTDSSIDYPTINDAKYAYYVQCGVTNSSNDLGIYGAVVNFAITDAKG